jgi:purine nucleoside permease
MRYQTIHHIIIQESNMIRYLLVVVGMTLFLSIGASAGEEAKKPAHNEKVVVVITHEVKEYSAWRKVFDADESNRKLGGFKVSGVYADVKNPNMVTIIGEFPNVAAVDAFVSSPKLKEAMEKGGVVGKPDVKVLTATQK